MNLSRLSLWVIMLLAVLIRIYGIWSWDLSYGDEFHTYLDSLNQPGQRGLFSGYYYLTHLSLDLFGHKSALAARIPAVFFGVVTLPIFYLLIKSVFDKTIATFALAILAFNQWHIEMSQYARYYSAVFLFATVHALFFLKFIQTGSFNQLLISIISALAAIFLHAAAIVVLLPAILHCLLSIHFSYLLPAGISKQTVLKVLIGILVLGSLGSLWFYEILSIWNSKSQINSYGNSWALVPLLSLNQFTLAVFISAFLGLITFKITNKPSEFVYISAGLVIAILTIVCVSGFVNFSVNYIFSLAPLFFISAASLCSLIYKTFNNRSLLISISLVSVLVISQLPGSISYFLERQNISYDDAYSYILENADPGALVVTNLGVALIDVSKLEVKKSKSHPKKRSFSWSKYLNRFKRKQQEVWLAWSVSRIGLAPKLKKWLNLNAELVYEKSSKRIDRREKTVTIWRLQK